MARLLLLVSLTLTEALPTQIASLGARRKLLSQGTTYCYLDASGALINDGLHVNIGCGAGEPIDAPVCTVGAGETMCSLGDNHNGVDENRWDAYSFDHCESVLVFVSPDDSTRYYCTRLASTGDWSPRRRPESADPETTGDSWLGCGWWWQNTQWHNDACRSLPRYLGEECWDDSGECVNNGYSSYDGLHLSCATVPEVGITTPTCIPSAFEIERNQCECGWFDWWLFVACGAGGGVCNGHPCVLSTGDGSHYCDYQANNDW